jgi:Domain of unknown function (DUF4278)
MRTTIYFKYLKDIEARETSNEIIQQFIHKIFIFSRGDYATYLSRQCIQLRSFHVRRTPIPKGTKNKLTYDLTYRGTTYHVDPSVKLKEVPKSVESHKLIYRGLVYYTNRNAQFEATPELAIAV